MKLIFLHGPPASGKYTLAQALNALHGVLNFHNHLTIEVARALFDFGSAEFWDLRHGLQRAALAARAEPGSANVVFTNSGSAPHDDETVAALEREVTSRGGEFPPVYLECSVQELEERVTSPARRAMHKLHTTQGRHDFLEAWNDVPLDRPETIVVRTGGRSPEDCAVDIARRLL